MMTFFDPDCSEKSKFLPEKESKHAIKSLRLRNNEAFDIINGNGLVLHATLKNDNKGVVEFEIIGIEKKKQKKPFLHLAVSPLKQNDRFEYFVEKSTELGIHEITPIFCRRTEKPRINAERLERIVISAMKQSGNSFKPIINPLTDLSKFMTKDLAPIRYFGHCEIDNKLHLKDLKFNENTVIAVGPEGDFDENEIISAKKNGFRSISLGDITLRTETAALAICAYFEICK